MSIEPRTLAEATLDDRGRLTLPMEIREQYGDRYHTGELPEGIKLVPVADDPLDALRDEFADVEEPADEILEGARDAAVDEAGR